MQRPHCVRTDAIAHPPGRQSRVTRPAIVGYIYVMVNPNMPWSLKGISDEARDFARQAADDADVPVGAWLSSVIRAAADAERGPEPTVPSGAAAASPTPPGPTQGGNTIERAVQIVSDFGFEPEGPAQDADLIEDADLLQATLESLERRIAESEALTEEALAPLEKEIDRIRRRLASLRGD